MKITRRLEFDYGHRVFGHEGKCQFLHGHRGIAEVTIQAPTLDVVGRVIDFGVVKALIGGWIDSNWDHNILLNRKDPLLPYLLATEGKVPYQLDGNPTAEIMAKELYLIAKTLLPPELRVTEIKLWETPNCYATYSPESDNTV